MKYTKRPLQDINIWNGPRGHRHRGEEGALDNGAAEDEIQDNIYSRYSKEGLTPSGHKTGQKLLMKDDAKIAAGTVLEAAHFLKPSEVPAYLEAHFEDSWNHFD